MNTTSKLSIATLAFAGLLATGCSQQQVAGGSQVAGSSQQVQTAPEVTPEPAAEPAKVAANPNAHTHPSIPGCTDSITHTHPSGAKSHNHKYGCKGGKRPARGGGGNKYTHTHPAIPGCTDSISHTHKYNNRNHSHKYSCKGGSKKGGSNVNVHALQRKLKAKGYYRGPINGVVTPQTRSALQRYMQNR